MAPTRSTARDSSAHASSHHGDEYQIRGNGGMIQQVGDLQNGIAGSAHSTETNLTADNLSTHATQMHQPQLRSRGSQASFASTPSLATSDVTLETDALEDVVGPHQQYQLPSLSRSTSPALSLASSSSSSLVSDAAIPSPSSASGAAPCDARSDGHADDELGLPDATDHFAGIGSGVAPCCDMPKKDNTAAPLDLPDATDILAGVGAWVEDVVFLRGHPPAAAF